MVFAGAFDDHDEIPNVMLSLGLANAIDGCGEVASRMGERGWRKKEVAVKIRE